METLLAKLTSTAHEDQVVVSQDLQNGMRLLVYPCESGTLLALGYERDQAQKVHAEEVLRRRTANLARFGAWLPCMFNNGSWYVVKRLCSSDAQAASMDDLLAAQELLS